MTVWMRNNGQGLVAVDVMMRWPPRYEEERTGSFLADAAELPRFSSQFLLSARLERGERFTFFGDAGKRTLPGVGDRAPDGVSLTAGVAEPRCGRRSAASLHGQSM